MQPLKKSFPFVVLILPFAISASFIPVTDDLWDISKGTVVTASSPTLYISNINNMFGAASGYVEPGNTLFIDWRPDGYTHWVEWKTKDPIELTKFNLLAAHDDGNRDITYRGLRSFTLKYLTPDNLWSTLYTYNTNYPTYRYYNPSAPANQRHFLYLSVSVLPTIAQNFRAEFVQCGSTDYASGPRIIELDGFGRIAVAEPAAASMLIMGLLIGLVGMRFKKT